MARNHYDETGFRCGLEIHVQLNTEKKLFCGCPNRRSAEFPIMHGNEVSGMPKAPLSCKISRRIRPAAGELGLTDPAALHEFLRGRKFSYGISSESACLVEMDEEPPHEMNAEALKIALSVAKALKCAVPDLVCVMRKAVADGSAVSSFQRTALVGVDGTLRTEQGEVRITGISLEEDSASPAADGKEKTTGYRLDRLGVPLIEIGTGTDIKNPAHARHTAEQIGMLLFQDRQRGIGAIRQDLNVSIKGGARVEIKGAQELGMIETIIENEIRRQQALLGIMNELKKRNASVGGAKNVTEFFRNTEASFIQKALKEGNPVFAGVLKGFAGLLKGDCGGKTFGKELSGYASVFGLGIVHSDELEKFPFLSGEFATLRKEFNALENDLIFAVAGRDAENACKAVLKRAEQSLKRVPEETRAANPDGTTSYLRPLPGSARMYPETDVPPIKTKKILAATRPPKSAEETLRELEKMLPKQMAEQMIRSEYLGLFEKLSAESKKYGPTTVANILLSVMKDLKRRGVPVENVSEADIEKIFSAEKNRDIAKDAIPGIIEKVSKGIPLDRAIKEAKKITEEELRDAVKNIFKSNPHLVRDRKISALMGEVMKKLRGAAEGKRVISVVREELEKEEA